MYPRQSQISKNAAAGLRSALLSSIVRNTSSERMSNQIKIFELRFSFMQYLENISCPRTSPSCIISNNGYIPSRHQLALEEINLRVISMPVSEIYLSSQIIMFENIITWKH